MSKSSSADLLSITAHIVAAHVSNNSVSVQDLPALIAEVHGTLAFLGSKPGSRLEGSKEPAVPVKKSITPDYLICLDDGKKFKTLKLHLQKAYGLTPGQYRAKWGLPPDYPMVAPNYLKLRSSLAKTTGLADRAKFKSRG